MHAYVEKSVCVWLTLPLKNSFLIPSNEKRNKKEERKEIALILVVAEVATHSSFLFFPFISTSCF